MLIAWVLVVCLIDAFSYVVALCYFRWAFAVHVERSRRRLGRRCLQQTGSDPSQMDRYSAVVTKRHRINQRLKGLGLTWLAVPLGLPAPALSLLVGALPESLVRLHFLVLVLRSPQTR